MSNLPGIQCKIPNQVAARMYQEDTDLEQSLLLLPPQRSPVELLQAETIEVDNNDPGDIGQHP